MKVCNALEEALQESTFPPEGIADEEEESKWVVVYDTEEVSKWIENAIESLSRGAGVSKCFKDIKTRQNIHLRFVQIFILRKRRRKWGVHRVTVFKIILFLI